MPEFHKDTLFIEDQYYPVAISSIRKVNDDRPVYDIQVNGCSTYVLDSGTISHNTKAKAARASFRVLMNMINKKNAALLIANHTYVNASGYVPVQEMSAGKGLEYNSSQVTFLSKKKLKDGQDVHGLSITATTQKNRFTPPFRKVSVDLSFEHGLSPYSGLLDVLVENGTIDGSTMGWFKFGPEGPDQIKFRRKAFDAFAAEHWNELKEFDVPKVFSSLHTEEDPQ